MYIIVKTSLKYVKYLPKNVSKESSIDVLLISNKLGFKYSLDLSAGLRDFEKLWQFLKLGLANQNIWNNSYRLYQI